MKQIARFVIQYRKDKGLTQKELGAKLGIHGQYISNVERQSRAYKMSFVKKMLRILRGPYRERFKGAVEHDFHDILDKKMGGM